MNVEGFILIVLAVILFIVLSIVYLTITNRVEDRPPYVV